MLKVGDRVQITGGKAGMVPKSLVGSSAKVVKLNLKTVKIRLEESGRELNVNYRAVLLVE
jgi:preprotein translocase subunit YajC